MDIRQKIPYVLPEQSSYQPWDSTLWAGRQHIQDSLYCVRHFVHNYTTRCHPQSHLRDTGWAHVIETQYHACPSTAGISFAQRYSRVLYTTFPRKGPSHAYGYSDDAGRDRLV